MTNQPSHYDQEDSFNLGGEFAICAARGKGSLRVKNRRRADNPSPAYNKANARNIKNRDRRKNIGLGAALGGISGIGVGGGLGGAAGVAIGGAVGSIIPGPGTLVGMAVGAAIGGAIGGAAVGGSGIAIGAGGAAAYEARQKEKIKSFDISK